MSRERVRAVIGGCVRRRVSGYLFLFFLFPVCPAYERERERREFVEKNVCET